MIETVYEEGYWWVVIPDELWKTREYVEWMAGYPWLIKRQ